jgi:ribosomal-protein-alanine N-acetyltransferase
LIGATIPEGWPNDELAEFLPKYAVWLAEDPSRLGYGPWLAIERESATLVGGAGFHGPPREGAIEIGFDVVPEFRNRGYASEVARALVEWGLAREDVTRVVAGCDPGNAPSRRVLEKIGMRVTDSPPGEAIRWVIDAI